MRATRPLDNAVSFATVLPKIAEFVGAGVTWINSALNGSHPVVFTSKPEFGIKFSRSVLMFSLTSLGSSYTRAGNLPLTVISLTGSSLN